MSESVIRETKPKPEFGRNIYFLAGVLMGALVFGIVATAAYKIGFARIRSGLGMGSRDAEVLEIPRDVLDDLKTHKAVIENVLNLAPQVPHDTILVEPDSELQYKLRPNVKLDVTVLNVHGDLNLDPPLVHVPANSQLSEKTKNYIRENARVAFSYSTDANGRRLTLPLVSAENKVLVVGDSVAFGVGVSDSDTMASNLQRILGKQVEVVNAGVGGYEGEQAFRMAEVLSRNQKYAALIYIACQNDFGGDGRSTILEDFKTIAERFNNHVVVFLETYMEYNLRDVLLAQGWSEAKIKRTSELRTYPAGQSKSLGFRFADWSDVVNDYRREQKSVFAPFGLYVDHCHLSPDGNRLMAERIVPLVSSQ
jgi:lysophospholipase L1-like esterase